MIAGEGVGGGGASDGAFVEELGGHPPSNAGKAGQSLPLTHLDPRVLSGTASCNVASNTCLAISPGGSRRARTAHPQSNARSELLGPSLEDLAQVPPDGDAAPGELGSGGAGGGEGGASAGATTDGAGAVALAAPDVDDDDAPSELLEPLLEEWPDLLGLVLAQLDPTDHALLSRVGKPWLAAVVSRGLPRAGKEGAELLKSRRFVASVEMLAWAKANGCPWTERTCNSIARGGHLAVLQWQGLTLVHFSAKLKRFLWYRGAPRGCLGSV